MTRLVLVLGVLGLLLASCADGSASDSSTNAGGDAASCVEVYGTDTVTNRAFAFDGTVSSVEMRSDPQLPPGEQEIPWVTFEVHQWFKGGTEKTVAVWVENLNIDTSVGTIEAQAGTHLLVSGEPRWGGAPLDDAIAWPCGFTRPWSEDVADEWEAAFRDRR